MLGYYWQKIYNHPYRHNKYFLITLILSLLVNIFIWILLYWKIHPLAYIYDQGKIALHYNVYLGIDKYDFWYNSFVLPLTGLIIFSINTYLSFKLYLKIKFFSYVLSTVSLLSQLILLAASFIIILLNI